MASEGGGAAAGGGQAVAPVRHSALVVTVIEAKELSNTQVVTAQVRKSRSLPSARARQLAPAFAEALLPLPPLRRRVRTRQRSPSLG